jgi:hypothetical protein
MLDQIETSGVDLEEARARIDIVRTRLQRALDAHEGDLEPLRQVLVRLERMAAEIAGIERVIEAAMSSQVS